MRVFARMWTWRVQTFINVVAVKVVVRQFKSCPAIALVRTFGVDTNLRTVMNVLTCEGTTCEHVIMTMVQSLHSSTSWHVWLSALKKKPVSHLQTLLPWRFMQMLLQLPLSSTHSSTSTHENLFLSNSNPLLHSQWKLPSEFMQTCWHLKRFKIRISNEFGSRMFLPSVIFMAFIYVVTVMVVSTQEIAAMTWTYNFVFLKIAVMSAATVIKFT